MSNFWTAGLLKTILSHNPKSTPIATATVSGGAGLYAQFGGSTFADSKIALRRARTALHVH
jgi:hypothetical protein